MAESRTDQTLVERIVRGKKGFLHRDPETGKRKLAEPGTRVKVRIGTAKAHSDVLQDPEVVKAQLAALEKEKEALEKDEAAKQAEKTGQSTSQGQGQSSQANK